MKNKITKLRKLTELTGFSLAILYAHECGLIVVVKR